MMKLKEKCTEKRLGLIIGAIVSNNNAPVAKDHHTTDDVNKNHDQKDERKDSATEDDLQRQASKSNSNPCDPYQEVANKVYNDLENEENGLVDRVDPEEDQLNPEEDELEVDNPRDDLLNDNDEEEETFNDDDQDIEEEDK